MAGISDTSDSDKNIGPPKKHASSGKRLASSSEEEVKGPKQRSSRTPSSMRKSENEDDGDDRRYSLRKRQRKLRMPSREERWSSIPTDSKVSNRLSHLTPRRVINDFTRITHRYNYDYTEVSGEESMEEFIKATDSSDTSESSAPADTGREKQKGHRVQGYRPRIAKVSDDSSDEDQPQLSERPADPKPQLSDHPRMSTRQQEKNNPPLRKAPNRNQRKRSTNQNRELPRKVYRTRSRTKEDPESSEEEVQPVSKKTTRRKLLLESDNEDSRQNSSSDDPIQPKVDKKLRKPSVLNSDSEEEVRSTAQPNVEDSKNKTGSSPKTAAESARQQGESEEKDPPDEKLPTDKKSADQCDQDDANSVQKVSVGKTCGTQTSTKDSVVVSSSDSAITVGDSDSDNSGDDDDSSDASDGSEAEDDSSEGEECIGRIQKLAAKRKKKRDSMFEQLKSARAKKQKQIST